MSIDACKRSARFNAQNGVSGFMSAKGPAGANRHPDRCVCNEKETTPHKHRREHPHSCARCVECKAYEPAFQLAEHAPAGHKIIHPNPTIEAISVVSGLSAEELTAL